MKTFSPTSSTRTSARSSGFTVIEVLVALVILLIGGLAIMNLFPPALNVIKGSENREIAMAQVKGALARYTNDSASIPDAIYDNTGVNDDVAVEGSRSRNASLPNTLLESDFNLSALGHFKHIVGERHKVLTYTETGSTPVTRKFVLLNYAYSGTPSVSVADSIEGVRVDNTGKLDFSDATKASDDSQFTPVAGFYYASYSFQPRISAGPPPTYGPLQSVIDEPVSTASLSSMQVFQGTTNAKVVSGPVTLQVFTNRPAPAAQPTDDPNAPFRGFLFVDSNLASGQEVVVDYNVLDWRWLMEDTSATVATNKSNPPLSAPAPATARDVKLAVPFLGTPSAASAALSGRALYTLTMPAPNSQGQLSVNPRFGQWTGTAGTVGTDVVLDVSSASATYDIADNAGVAMIAPRVRTSYWASHGWAQQLSVAASSYYQYDAARATNGFPQEPWREYAWSGAGTSDSNTLYFHASEAGKTIMVSFLNGTNKVANQIVTIGSRIKNAPASVPSGFGSKVAEAILAESNGDPAGTVTALTSVRGVSVRARTAWQQGSDYTQEVAEMYRPLN